MGEFGSSLVGDLTPSQTLVPTINQYAVEVLTDLRLKYVARTSGTSEFSISMLFRQFAMLSSGFVLIKSSESVRRTKAVQKQTR